MSELNAKLWVIAAYSSATRNLHPQIWNPNAGPVTMLFTLWTYQVSDLHSAHLMTALNTSSSLWTSSSSLKIKEGSIEAPSIGKECLGWKD